MNDETPEPNPADGLFDPIDAKLRALPRPELEVHLLACLLLGRDLQREAGSIQWIEEHDPVFGASWCSYCGRYRVSLDGVHLWAYTPQDVAPFTNTPILTAQEYCELHFQATLLKAPWDVDSWDRFEAWRRGRAADSSDEQREARLMREWLSTQQRSEGN